MKKIRNTLMLTMMVVSLLPVLLIGGYSYYSSSQTLRETALSQQSNRLEQLQQALEYQLSGVEQDLLYLSDASAMQLYLASKTGDTRRNQLLLTNLRNSLQQFTQQHSLYSAMRLLDRKGDVLVAIDRQSDVSNSETSKTAGKKAAALNLRARDYFSNTISLQRGQVYISPLELRRNEAGILKPHQPTIRYATVVKNTAGSTQGVLVLNLDAQQLIDQLTQSTQAGWQSLLTDPQGYYYSHPDPALRWGSARDLDTKHNAFNDESLGLAALKTTGISAQLETKDSVVLSRKLTLGKGRPELGYLITLAPKALISKPIDQYLLVFLGIVLLSLVLSLWLAKTLADSLSKPLVSLTAQVEKLTKGDIETPINSKASNEIGELSQAIELLRKSMNILMKRSRKGS
jgi:HAMP domain-containing protein